eukprot:g39282.t1
MLGPNVVHQLEDAQVCDEIPSAAPGTEGTDRSEDLLTGPLLGLVKLAINGSRQRAIEGAIMANYQSENRSVYPRTLWEAREVVAGPLAETVVLSIATSEVPEDWRLANAVPLFKKVIYVNDLDVNTGGIVSKFVDDTKIGVVDSEKVTSEFNGSLIRCANGPKSGMDVVKLERVQKRFINMLPGLESLSCRKRLTRLGLFSLEHQRPRRDLTEVYKIMKGMDTVNSRATKFKTSTITTVARRNKAIITKLQFHYAT